MRANTNIRTQLTSCGVSESIKGSAGKKREREKEKRKMEMKMRKGREKARDGRINSRASQGEEEE